MGLYSYDIEIASAAAKTVTATMCSAPTYTVSSVRLVAQPVFYGSAQINGVSYSPGEPLIQATGGTVFTTSPLSVTGATTTALSTTVITGTYSSATTAAVFVVPFGTTFNASTAETDAGGSPREYGGVTALAETIIAGDIRVSIGREPRVPAGGPSTYKACSVTQV
jgi:hypothetical protein